MAGARFVSLLESDQAIHARGKSTHSALQRLQGSILLVHAEDVDSWAGLCVLVRIQYVQQPPITAEVQVRRACKARDAVGKRHASRLSIDLVYRNRAAYRVRHVGESPVLAHHHPTGPALTGHHRRAYELQTPIIEQEVRGEGSFSYSIVEVVGNEDLVAIRDIKAERVLSVVRSHRGSG